MSNSLKVFLSCECVFHERRRPFSPDVCAVDVTLRGQTVWYWCTVVISAMNEKMKQSENENMSENMETEGT